MHFNKSCQTDIIYLDFSQCFDRVVQNKLVCKLSKYVFQEMVFKCIENLLTNNIQTVKVDNSTLQCKYVVSGILQCIVLDPSVLFFCTDINSFSDNCTPSVQVDYTKVCKSA